MSQKRRVKSYSKHIEIFLIYEKQGFPKRTNPAFYIDFQLIR